MAIRKPRFEDTPSLRIAVISSTIRAAIDCHINDTGRAFAGLSGACEWCGELKTDAIYIFDRMTGKARR